MKKDIKSNKLIISLLVVVLVGEIAIGVLIFFTYNHINSYHGDESLKTNSIISEIQEIKSQLNDN